MILRKSPRDIKRMAQSGRLASEALLAVEDRIRPGVTTKELDQIAYDVITKAGAEPAFLGYLGYPATICASVNEQVVHGIPSDEVVLQEGDVISVDVGTIYKGYYGDNAMTYPVGAISPEAAELLKVTRESLYRGLNALSASAPLGLLSHTIQTYAEEHGFSVVRSFAGHGIGKRMHEEPHVPNYGRADDGPIIPPGTVLAVEPMVNAGTHDVKTLSDGWTVVTTDGRPSAHFEHTVAVLSDGVEILTNWDAAS